MSVNSQKPNILNGVGDFFNKIRLKFGINNSVNNILDSSEIERLKKELEELKIEKSYFEKENEALKEENDILKGQVTRFDEENVVLEKAFLNEHYKLSEQRDLLNEIINNLSNGVSYKSIDGKYLSVNNSFCQIAGISENEIIGKTSFDIFPKEKAKEFEDYNNQILSGEKESVTFDTEIIVNNEVKYYTITKIAHKNENGEIIGIIQNLVDITDYKKRIIIEEGLKDSTKKMYSELLHDFSTPINGVSGFSQLLSMEIEDNPNISNEIKILVSKLELSTNKLIDNLNNFRSFQQLESGNYTLKEKNVNLPNILNLIYESVKIAGDYKIITKYYDSDTKINLVGNIFIDDLLLVPAFENIIKNAVEATNDYKMGEKEDIVINITKNTEELIVSVKNIGVIPKEIVNNFGTYGLTKNKKGGTGIGIYSIKRRVEAHGGTVFPPEIIDNKYTQITFSIPIK